MFNVKRNGDVDILIVDDDLDMRRLFHSVLSQAGFRRLQLARDGAEALKLLADKPIDVVFVDQKMPRLDGMGFLSAVRALPDDRRALPIIMMTEHAALEPVREARDRGVSDVLRKPVSAQGILTRLHRAMDDPRPFINATSYVGPDRRRRQDPAHAGPWRRCGDAYLDLDD